MITVKRVFGYTLRRTWLLRPTLNRVYMMVFYGLPYAVCFSSIYGLSFSEGRRIRRSNRVAKIRV